jgi:O-antigen ligase
MRPDPGAVLKACTGLGLFTVLLAPFAFGAVGLEVWPVLATLWIVLGLAAFMASRRLPAVSTSARMNPMPGPVLVLHMLFAVQLVPLPPSLLKTLSSGSFAAHFIPPPAIASWAPLSVSETGTSQAWLFVAGLQGLAIAIFAAPKPALPGTMRLLFLGMAGAGGILALEGLVQSRSAHPYWLYGMFRVPGAGSHEAGIFGPYYNRDHYSNLLAIAGSVSAALLGLAAREGAFGSLRAFARSDRFARNVALVIALCLVVVASAACGSRGGLISLFVGLLVGFWSALRARPGLALSTVGLLALALFGIGAPASFVRMTDIDFEASRLLVWRDALRLIEFFPLFGCGIGAFAPAYWPYQRVVRMEYWPHLHNEYGQWLLEGGLSGMLIAGYVLRLVWIALPRLVSTPAARPALAGLAAAMTHAFVDCGFRIPANAAWAALLLVCLTVVAQTQPDSVRRR